MKNSRQKTLSLVLGTTMLIEVLSSSSVLAKDVIKNYSSVVLDKQKEEDIRVQGAEVTESPTETSNINVDAKSALLIEPSTGKIIYEKNIHEKFAPASVTKIMTMLLTMEAIDNENIKLSDKVTCSENAKKMGGSSMLLDNGEVRSVEDLLKGVAIASGNDAAVALAEYIGGSIDGFVSMMNKRAEELGMKNTAFKNPTGLSAEGHYTTAHDISVMSRELLKHDKILNYSSIYMETISEGRKSPIELVNHNKLVRFFKGCDGLKTGFTSEAKYCISATATRDGVRMLTVIMGAPTYKIRNADASMLMNFGFSKFEVKKLATKNDTIKKIVLDKKGEKFFNAKSSKDLESMVEKGKIGKITKKIKIKEDLTSIKKDAVIGKCDFYNGETLLGSVDLISDRDVKVSNILGNLKDLLQNLFDSAI